MTESKTDPNWIFIESGTLAMICHRCGARQSPQLPMPVDQWLESSEAFQKTHSQCPGPTKAIFLDFDGVLAGDHVLGEIWFSHVMLLNRIWRATGAGIVFSTSWRESFTLQELTKALHDQGLDSSVPILGATPVLARETDSESGLVLGVSRWLEIEAWLNEHPEIESFAILDDTIFDDFPHENTVKCHPSRGLDDLEAQQVIDILGGKET